MNHIFVERNFISCSMLIYSIALFGIYCNYYVIFSSSRIDSSAAENVGRVLAQRCLQCGITSMTLKPQPDQNQSGKVQTGWYYGDGGRFLL